MSHDKQWLVGTGLGLVAAVLWQRSLGSIDVGILTFLLVKIWYRLDVD